MIDDDEIIEGIEKHSTLKLDKNEAQAPRCEGTDEDNEYDSDYQSDGEMTDDNATEYLEEEEEHVLKSEYEN